MSTHHHHHHLGYSLLPAQYNLPYAAGKALSSSFVSISVVLPVTRPLPSKNLSPPDFGFSRQGFSV
jgi:hypothetical protein